MSPVGNRDQLRGEHVEGPQRGVEAADEEVVLPDEEAEQHHSEQARDGDPVAPQRFPGEDGQDLEQDPHPGKGEDVDLRMAEEPEQVLEQVGAAAGAGEEEGGLNAAVEGDHQQSGDQHRRRKHHQDRGAEGAPAEDRQAAPGQARRAHGDDRGDQVQPQEGHRDTDQGEEEDVGVEAVVGLVVERGVTRPTGREAAEEDRRDEDHPGRHQQPEGERLDPREGHPPRADHQRHEVVGERAEDARGHHSHHHRAVQADERQVVAGIEELRRGTQQLGPDQHRVEAADEEEEADPEQVLDPDDLVVGAEPEVAADAARPRSRRRCAGDRPSCSAGSGRSRGRSGNRSRQNR